MSAAAEELQTVFKQAVDRAQADPQWFFNTILKFPAQEWQLEAISAVFDVRRKARGEATVCNHEGKPRISIRSCHGTGKTQLLAMLMHIWNFCTYGKIACTAPKEAQLLRCLMPRQRLAMREAIPEYRQQIDIQGREIFCFGDRDWGAVMETASDPENLAGYHDSPQLFVIDEASAKRLDGMFPVIEGALTTPGSVSVEIGNPTRIDGEFYNHHNKVGVKDLYYLMHIKPSDAPQFIDQKWLTAMRQKYGENSPIYLVRALGEFASFDDALLVHPELIEEALDSEREPDGSFPVLKVTIDVADGGADSTVITVARHYQSFIQVIKQKAFWFESKHAPIDAGKAAIQMFDAFHGNAANGDVIIPDANGVGSGTAGYIMDRKYPCAVYVGGKTANDPVRFRNKRVECSILCQEALANGTLVIAEGAIDDEEEFRAHCLSIKRDTNSDKFDDIEPKRKILEAGLPSPDRWDSLMMQFLGKSSNVMADNFVPMVYGTLESASYDGGLA